MAGDTSVHVEASYVTSAGMHVTEQMGSVDDLVVALAKPVRRIRSHRGQKHRPGLFWSATTGDHVPYESWLELDRLWLADADPEVTWISGQPLLLRGVHGQKVRSHVPDFLLRRRGRPLLLVDVKPAQFAEEPRVAAVFEWTRLACQTQGWDYEVWTGAPARALANVRALAVGRRFTEANHVRLAASNHARMTALTRAWSTGASFEEVALNWQHFEGDQPA